MLRCHNVRTKGLLVHSLILLRLGIFRLGTLEMHIHYGRLIGERLAFRTIAQVGLLWQLHVAALRESSEQPSITSLQLAAHALHCRFEILIAHALEHQPRKHTRHILRATSRIRAESLWPNMFLQRRR